MSKIRFETIDERFGHMERNDECRMARRVLRRFGHMERKDEYV